MARLKKETMKDAVKPTLVANMEKVVTEAEDCMLSDEFMVKVKDNLDFISNKLDIDNNEALFLSLFMEMCDNDAVDLLQIGRYLKCTKLRLMGMKCSVDSLSQKGYLKKASRSNPFGEDRMCYSLPRKVVDAVMADRKFEPEPLTGLKTEDLFDRVAELFEASDDVHSLLHDINVLLENNRKLPYAKKVIKHITKKLSPYDQILFHFFSNQLVNEFNDEVEERDWRFIFQRRAEARHIHEALQSNKHPLQTLGLVESVPDNGMFGPKFHLTNKAKMEFFPDMASAFPLDGCANDLLKWDSFPVKRLYYNQAEQLQITQIADLLQEDKFKAVQKRLEETGMRKGFACLFYGAPGTGKTETVYQLARMTGRDVMVIDVSQIKDKFVGESEKNIKASFERYRMYVKSQKKAPILLFNEADAVWGVRKEGARHAVDKMENSVQNIILQEMEQLEGIMIATTNLTQNLDSAFERRFIYKVEFNKPSVEAKKSIWCSMVPTMDDCLAQSLAESYDFSGGQIENIARKRAVSYVLTGQEPTDEDYRRFCDDEHIQQKKQHNRVGFF